jgi:hypothetical protein
MDEAEGDADARMVQTIAWLRRRGYRIEDPPDLATRLRRQQRDEFLRLAGELISAGSTWARSVALAREVGTFESILWPRWRDLPSPPGTCSELRRHLFEAHKLGELPESERQLYAILKRDGASHFSGDRD